MMSCVDTISSSSICSFTHNKHNSFSVWAWVWRDEKHDNFTASCHLTFILKRTQETAGTCGSASSLPRCLLSLPPSTLSCHLMTALYSPAPRPNPHPPQRPIRLCLQTKQRPSPYNPPSPPSSHIPLSCAAAAHKYINLVSVNACVRVYVCVF